MSRLQRLILSLLLTAGGAASGAARLEAQEFYGPPPSGKAPAGKVVPGDGQERPQPGIGHGHSHKPIPRSVDPVPALEIPPGMRGPIARLESNEFDWGRKLQGQDILHTFAVHNDGDMPLTIINVKPG